MTTTYRGCECYETTTTTGEGRTFGHVWGIRGRYTKPALRTPFLTSAAQCRAWIREQDELRDALADEAR